MCEYALLASPSESAIALGSSGRVEFARDRLHLFEFVRWGMVPESMRVGGSSIESWADSWLSAGLFA